MKRSILGVFCSLIAMFLSEVAIPRQQNAQPEISTAKLVTALRILNTEEYDYRNQNHRFAERTELLRFLQQNRRLSGSPIDLENPKPYELAITTSSDGAHYQITLQRPSDMHDKSTWCKAAAFSDDRGIIFLGQAIGCQGAPR